MSNSLDDPLLVRRQRRDGVALAYLEVGSGAPPMLFVHGWLCDHTHFAPQIEYFSRHHRVIAVDLRGHGASDKPREDYTMASFADDLAWLCGRLEIERPVVVGHSMGGVIAIELAARLPNLPGAVVLLDAPVVMSDEAVRGARQECVELRAPNYREVARRWVEAMFLPTDDPERRARIVAQMIEAPRHVMVSACEEMFACDTAAVVAACRVPLLNVASAEGRSADLDRFRELCPQLVNGQTVGAGHFHQLEVPDQTNAMIDRFLAVYVG